MGWKQDVVLVKYPHTETLCALWTSTDPSCLSATSTHQKEKLGGFTDSVPTSRLAGTMFESLFL